MPERGQLEKLIIDAYTTADYSGSSVATFTVMLNPDEYMRVYDIEYEERQGAGATGSPMVYKRIKPQEYTLKFLIDGTGVTGEQIEVNDKVNEFFEAAGYDGDIHRPRYLQVIWGTLRSNCVLLKAEITYKMFKPDGTPLRAIINASFREAVDDTTRVRQDRASSPNLTHIRTVRDNDRLVSMVYDIYGEIGHYMDVARTNGLPSVRSLKVGGTIVFPPFEKASS
jgi:hypothetical protein